MRLTLNFIKAGVIFDHYKKIEIRSQLLVQLRGKQNEDPLNVSGGGMLDVPFPTCVHFV
jgi:hypothetical protein